MLRQVFLYHKGEIIFRYDFAQGYDSETVETVFSKTLEPFITNPSQGQVFNKPLFDLQAHFVFDKNVLFLFVTDMADRPKTIKDELQRAARLFFKNFKDPSKIKEDSMEKEEFLDYIKETHYYLHPKISLAGPLGAGKTTIKNILAMSDEPEKTNSFAEYYQIKLGDLYFDLWDFTQKDNFSPLWNNCVRGSDTIIMVFSGVKLLDPVMKRFSKLIFQEGKYSTIAVLLTHTG